MKALAAGLVLLLCGCAADLGTGLPFPAVSEPARWVPISEFAAVSANDATGLSRLAQAYPDSGSVRLRLLNARLEAGDAQGALEVLRWLAARGYVFGEGARRQLPALLGEADAAEAGTLLLAPPDAVERSAVIATVPAEAGLVESLLMDLDGGRIAVTSVSGRNLWSGEANRWKSVPVAGAGNLSGIVWDPSRQMIWSASGAIDGSDEDMFAGLVGIRHPGDDPQLVAAPAGAELSDLHRAADGSIYASDPIGGGLYVLKPGADSLDPLVAPGAFRSPQGLATAADDRFLYVSDYRYGLAAVELASGRIFRVDAQVPLLLDGIDGLWRHGSELVAVQNGTSPMRIVALELSPDGLAVTGSRILERAHREWTEPLSGYLGGDALYYVGNGQWDRFERGEPIDGKVAQQTQIRRLPLEP